MTWRVAIQPTDLVRMTDSLYVDGPWRGRKSSRFWVLLTLAAVIATAGVIADSTATVIGAMIVAPLMTPILGTALALVLAHRGPLLHSVLLVILGAASVITSAYLFGLVASPADAFAANGQVAARISPRLIDLIAALATGLVGAFALIRSDISDALPGVAIAISLVPPLAVVGLLLSVERYADAAGAALLFGTNVAAIIATGAAVFLAYRLRRVQMPVGLPLGRLRGWSLAVVVGLLLIVAVPLTVGSVTVARDELLAAQAKPVAEAWAAGNDWLVTNIQAQKGVLYVAALGSPPDASPRELRVSLDQAGLADVDLVVQLVLGGAATCPAGSTRCVDSAHRFPT